MIFENFRPEKSVEEAKAITCAIASLSIMAKIRQPEKVEKKLTTYHVPEHKIEKPRRSSIKMSSSLESTTSSSYSSSPESQDDSYSSGHDDFDNMISGINRIQICKSVNLGESDEDNETVVNGDNKSKFVYQRNLASSDDEKSDNKLSDEDEDDEGLIERGPVRPQMHPVNRSRPYVETNHWSATGSQQHNENSTDYDTSAKEILRYKQYREKIDFCLDRLSDMSQDQRSMTQALSPAHSDFGGASGYSPPQQQPQNWMSENSPTSLHANSNSPCSLPSITVCDPESSLLEILSRGGFQPAAQVKTPEHVSCAASVASSSLACASDNWPDSPASSYNNYATSASRPDSRASSRAQSPGSNNGCSGSSFLNVLSSPLGSPQVSPQNFRNLQRPSSSSSSSQSYCETPSPANYQNPLDQHLEEQLGDHIMSRMPAWRDSFESSDTLVNSVDSSELQLQLVEEVIRGEMNDHNKGHLKSDAQVVPDCQATSASPNYTMTSGNQLRTTTCMDNNEATDDLTSTLLRFVGGEQAIVSTRKVEARSNSTTSGYSSSSSSSEAWRMCDSNCLQVDQQQSMRNTILGSSSSPTRQQTQQQQQTVYNPQCMNVHDTMNVNNLQYSPTSLESMRKTSWQNYSESSSTVVNSSSTSYFSDFQIPETVTSYNSQRSKSTIKSVQKSGNRSLAPWPSLNLPSTRASERLKEVTDPAEVEKAMKNLLKKPLDQLAKSDEDGDTMLMCLVGNPSELNKKLAYLVPLVERLATVDGALSKLNNRGDDALYLAAMNCPEMAFVAGYLAAAFLQKNIDIGQRLYRSRGDTLIHALAAKGDSHGQVLAELLSLKTSQGNSVFDLTKRNYDGRTALHVAAEAHDSLGRNTRTTTIATTRLLMYNGADPTIREVRCGDTALHLAVSLSCDPSLIKTLLTGRGREAVNIANYNGNTPLHIAAVMSERTSLERQSEICWHLIQAGGKTNLTNRQGKSPLALVSADRKEALKRIFHRRS